MLGTNCGTIGGVGGPANHGGEVAGSLEDFAFAVKHFDALGGVLGCQVKDEHVFGVAHVRHCKPLVIGAECKRRCGPRASWKCEHALALSGFCVPQENHRLVPILARYHQLSVCAHAQRHDIVSVSIGTFGQLSPCLHVDARAALRTASRPTAGSALLANKRSVLGGRWLCFLAAPKYSLSPVLLIQNYTQRRSHVDGVPLSIVVEILNSDVAFVAVHKLNLVGLFRF